MKRSKQNITSANTSMNSSKVPILFSLVDKRFGWKRGTLNFDLGGGKFDTATKWLKTKGVENVIFDPYNRSETSNTKAIKRRVGTVTVSNVLNVIRIAKGRTDVIISAAEAVKRGGIAYFTIYEGDRSGKGRKTRDGWQENRKAETYIKNIWLFFNEVERHGKLIIAKKSRFLKDFSPVKN